MSDPGNKRLDRGPPPSWFKARDGVEITRTMKPGRSVRRRLGRWLKGRGDDGIVFDVLRTYLKTGEFEICAQLDDNDARRIVEALTRLDDDNARLVLSYALLYLRPTVLYDTQYKLLFNHEDEEVGRLFLWIIEEFSLSKSPSLIALYEEALDTEDATALALVLSALCSVSDKVSEGGRRKVRNILRERREPRIWRAARDFLYPELRPGQDEQLKNMPEGPERLERRDR